MKRIFLIALTAALAISLWFNWRNRPSVAHVIPVSAVDIREAAAPVLPVKLEEIDFSGTGLADEAWQLKPPGVQEKIPSALPTAESGELKPALPAAEEWNPDVKLKLNSRQP